MCPQCGDRLRFSRYVRNDAYKSCPKCSVRLGVHAYYEYDYFGMRGDIIQSYCPAYRSGSVDGQPVCLCT